MLIFDQTPCPMAGFASGGHRQDNSIIVCIRNRPDSFRRSLGSFAGLHVPGLPPVELVMVDNASCDHISKVLESGVAALPFALLPVQAMQPGLRLARRAGVAASHGDLVAFTDDDCLVPVARGGLAVSTWRYLRSQRKAGLA